MSEYDEKKKKCDLPEIQEFLNLSRSLVRQIKLLSKMEISEEYLRLTKEVSVKVALATSKWSKTK